jgi:Peptidase_C39 like family/Tetratricopeptide repeat
VGLEALKLRGREAMANARPLAGVLLCIAAFFIGGCAGILPQTAALGRGGLPRGLPERMELTAVPFFPQSEYQCGPAALATTLAASGAKVTPEELVPQVYLPERKGSLQVEMLAAARRHGMVSYVLAPSFESLLREIAAGNPVIVLQNLGFVSGWHYAVAVGYDYDRGELILRSGTTERAVLPFAVHEFVWKRSGYWAMVAVPPERIPATADETRWLGAIAATERVGAASSARAARTAYEQFLSRWPNNAGAAVALANAHYKAGDLARAESVLRDALRHNADSAIVLNNLAQTLSDQGRNTEALPFAERAAAAGAGGPFAPAIDDTRRTILERLGKK